MTLTFKMSPSKLIKLNVPLENVSQMIHGSSYLGWSFDWLSFEASEHSVSRSPILFSVDVFSRCVSHGRLIIELDNELFPGSMECSKF